jgi:beta-lactamase regulating signal transducer with metallopeptidase domain
MTISTFPFLLVKLNLAMGTAIILVGLLRRPLRRWFGATVAYAIWYLVPTAGVASRSPPRVQAPAPLRVTPVHMPADLIHSPTTQPAPTAVAIEANP